MSFSYSRFTHQETSSLEVVSSLSFLPLPVSLAWDAFGEGNGATSLEEVRIRIAKYRTQLLLPFDDPLIGCIILEEPFFFDEQAWIPTPPDFKASVQVGNGYDAESGTGLMLWREVTDRLQENRVKNMFAGPATVAAQDSARFGKPVLVSPRLGQGSFRVLITDTYHRRCAMTAERTLPVLEAAHIRPYAEGGQHALLRSDVHKLFDLGYITVEPKDKKILVSRKNAKNLKTGGITTPCTELHWLHLMIS